MATLALGRYVHLLRAELAYLSRDIHDQLERRKQILAAAARVAPADAVLILNQTAEELGEERLAVVQLRRLHPLLLGDLSDRAIYKRVERLPEGVVRGKSPTTRSLSDILVDIMKEVEP